ncbi:hypothetical protein D3C86_2167150 [compost metagenome]
MKRAESAERADHTSRGIVDRVIELVCIIFISFHSFQIVIITIGKWYINFRSFRHMTYTVFKDKTPI